MQFNNILFTGESPYLTRHDFLFKAMSAHFKNIHILQRTDEWYEAKQTTGKGVEIMNEGIGLATSLDGLNPL